MPHPPYARGVTHLMYVGDDGAPQQASMLASPIFWLGAAALAGGAIGIKKRERKLLGLAAVVAFLAI